MVGLPRRTDDRSREPGRPRRHGDVAARVVRPVPAAAAVARPPASPRSPSSGPGLVSGFADNDAGGITTYSLAGANFGYALLWVILASQIVLFFTQEVGARLGLATGKGLISLIRERWGVRWTVFAALLMLAANLGSIVAEFAGIGSALGIFGVPPQISAAVAAVVVVGLHRARVVQPRAVPVRRRGDRSSRSPTCSPRSRPSRTGRCAAQSLFRPAPAVLARSTGLRSSARWARRSRPGARPSSSPTSRTRACGRTTCRRAASTCSRARCSPTSSPGSSWSPARRRSTRTGTKITTAADAAQALEPIAGQAAALRVRDRPAGGVVPGPRRRAAVERLHDLRGVRLGDRRRLELARGAGVLRPAGVLHRVRRAVRDDPRAAADPRSCSRPRCSTRCCCRSCWCS